MLWVHARLAENVLAFASGLSASGHVSGKVCMRRNFDRKKRRSILSWGVLAVALAMPRVLAEPCADTCPAPMWIDDRRITDAMTAGLHELLQKGPAPSMQALVQQLNASRCTVELPRPKSSILSPADIYERKKEGVLIVGTLMDCAKCGKRHASLAGGFVVTRDGVAVTAHHLVERPDHLVMGVMTWDGRLFPVTSILAADKGADVVVFQMDGTGFQPLSLSDQARVGDPVTVISHPDNRYYSVTTGVISRYYYEKIQAKAVRRVAVTADFAGGSSGCPVLDQRGNVVGMVVRTSSLYAEGMDEKHDHLQMVVKSCVSSDVILELFP